MRAVLFLFIFILSFSASAQTDNAVCSKEFVHCANYVGLVRLNNVAEAGVLLRIYSNINERPKGWVFSEIMVQASAMAAQDRAIHGYFTLIFDVDPDAQEILPTFSIKVEDDHILGTGKCEENKCTYNRYFYEEEPWYIEGGKVSGEIVFDPLTRTLSIREASEDNGYLLESKFQVIK